MGEAKPEAGFGGLGVLKQSGSTGGMGRYFLIHTLTWLLICLPGAYVFLRVALRLPFRQFAIALLLSFCFVVFIGAPCMYWGRLRMLTVKTPRPMMLALGMVVFGGAAPLVFFALRTLGPFNLLPAIVSLGLVTFPWLFLVIWPPRAWSDRLRTRSPGSG